MKVDIVPYKKINELYLLHAKKDEIFAYFDIPNSKKNSLKIIYPYTSYAKDVNTIKEQTLFYYFFSSLALLFLSIFYSLYSIKPIKKALFLLDEFLKDIIHDLNTPISSILLNIKILKQNHSAEAVKRVEFSTKKIGSLYGNLEAIIKNAPLEISKIDIKNMLNQKIDYFQYLYPDIIFRANIKINTIETSHSAIDRILDNLISNACKYNKENGKISITIDEKQLIIEDTGIGIKNPKKIFKRYYKEGQRGIGLGLNIVKKLCDSLNYKIKVQSILGIGTKFKVTFK